jgi:ADP-ribose pyrophosphatase YjhB (NUDIX family)
VSDSLLPILAGQRLAVCVGAVGVSGRRALFVRRRRANVAGHSSGHPWERGGASETPEVAAARETQEEAASALRVRVMLAFRNLRKRAGWAFVFLCRHLGGAPAPDGLARPIARRVPPLADEMAALGSRSSRERLVCAPRLRGEYRLIPLLRALTLFNAPGVLVSRGYVIGDWGWGLRHGMNAEWHADILI